MTPLVVFACHECGPVLDASPLAVVICHCGRRASCDAAQRRRAFAARRARLARARKRDAVSANPQVSESRISRSAPLAGIPVPDTGEPSCAPQMVNAGVRPSSNATDAEPDQLGAVNDHADATRDVWLPA